MNVTSLLNANAAEQQRKDAAKNTPTRNRTPWDAGGYALPINTMSGVPMVQSLSSSTTRASTPAQSNTQNMTGQESIQDTPTSPRHKFSDSRSSLSSYASSMQSASHSRFSSLSTVGSLQQVNNIDEALLRSKDPTFDIGMCSQRNMDGNRPTTTRPISHGSISPTSSMEALVLAAERHSVTQRPLLQRTLSVGDSSLSQSTEKPSKSPASDYVPRHRPSSPSDAILIKRTSGLPMLRVMTGDQDLRAADDSNIRTYLSAPLDHHINSLISNGRGHKRAISAPNFGDLSNPSFQMSKITSSPNTGPRPAPTPPHSTHPDNESPMSPMNATYPAPDTPPANIDINNNDMTLRCMFVENCKTESQLRKAISHIFGRNKMCTRQIPDAIWVHYCRKHYQRSRYRDPKRFVKVQSDLVLQQIHQIHNWSEQNRLNGRPGVVESWGLAVRKREQKRLDDLSSNRKRTASVLDSDVDTASGMSASQPHTAVPDWMLELTGTGYATSQMLEIFGRLQEEVSINKHMSFPDVEILPNIIVNQDEPKSPKGYTKRASGGTGHKRAQSLGVNMKSDYFSNARHSAQPSAWNQEAPHPGSVYSSPIQKRRRGNELGENHSPVAPFRNHFERPIEVNRRMSSFSQQSMYNIAEHEVVNERYIQQAPLLAPVAQRLGGQTMANHLEDTQYNQARRAGGHHQRSQSDMSGFSRGHLGYSPQVPSSVYTPELQQQSQFGRQAYHEQPRTVHQYPSPQPQWQPIPMQNMQPMHSGYQRPVSQHQRQPGFGNVYQHQRNQSTPMVQMGYGHHPGQQFGGQQNYNDRVIMEDPQNRNMYAPRHQG